MKRLRTNLVAGCVVLAAMWIAINGCGGTAPITDTNTNGNANDNDNANESDIGLPALGSTQITFPETGDVLFATTEDNGLGSAVFLGYDDGASIHPTRVVTDAGHDQLTINFDVKGRPAQFIFGGATTDMTHNDDGTIDITISDSSGVLYTDSAVQISSRGALQFSDSDLTQCAEAALLSAALAIDPLFAILSDCLTLPNSIAIRQAEILCLTQNALSVRLAEVIQDCPNQPDSSACIDRTQPWLEAIADAQDAALAGVQVNVQQILSAAPECSNVVTQQGLMEDDDEDGVMDGNDLCPGTPADERVTPYGCSDSQFGAIDCELLVEPGGNCKGGDGCCEESCLFPNFDPDCSNAIVCTESSSIGVGFCCEGDGCDTTCPEEDVDCADDPDNSNSNSNGNDNGNGDDNGNANDNTNDNGADDDGVCAGSEGDGFTLFDAVHDFGDSCGSCIQSDGRDLIITWTGCPTYPVTVEFIPLGQFQGGCSDDLNCETATIQIAMDDVELKEAIGAVDTYVFPKAIQCPSNLELSDILSYELVLTDATGFSAALDRVSFQCSVNPVTFTCPCE
jgi:hypothetical protein